MQWRMSVIPMLPSFTRYDGILSESVDRDQEVKIVCKLARQALSSSTRVLPASQQHNGNHLSAAGSVDQYQDLRQSSEDLPEGPMSSNLLPSCCFKMAQHSFPRT